MREFIDRCAEWLSGLPLAQQVAGADYLFPGLEIAHVIGLTLVVGAISIVDLRLLGWASTGRTVRDLSHQMLPFAWAGFGIALASGGLLFASNATVYVWNPPFQFKMLILLLAGLNMAVFHTSTWRSIARWDAAPKPPVAARLAGGLSLGFWVTIVCLGRWIGFVL